MTKFEEKIKEIMRKYIYKDGDIYVFYSHKHMLKTAKEISSIAYPKEFTIWCLVKMNNGILKQGYDGDHIYYYLLNVGLNRYTLDELFSYWCENIDK